jgi:hypothetical protein
LFQTLDVSLKRLNGSFIHLPPKFQIFLVCTDGELSLDDIAIRLIHTGIVFPKLKVKTLQLLQLTGLNDATDCCLE